MATRIQTYCVLYRDRRTDEARAITVDAPNARAAENKVKALRGNVEIIAVSVS
ncbi:hypothetical protein H1164_04000 [Thermoactinomyces daqus]|uniref:Uncharacterized protein n=1 Tax=Thermoactinomyces daqus TaxID=1329516 RepID=A0A7W1X8L0_9BACL|nr:hypothetical protein [Thermoactinomyces daqus]MBA4542063.1 hypothetical protein [Thermoactinomyces daqus]